MSRAWHFLAAFLVLLAFALLCDAKLWRPHDVFTIAENIQIAEAQAWWQGKLDLPERKWDSALYNGKVYSHFPPLFSYLSALVTPFYDGVPHWFVLLIVALPIPIFSYLLFRRFTSSPIWAAIFAFGFACGTSTLPVVEKALRGAGPYFVNQALALTGLLMFLCEYFGRQRVLLAGMGVIVATWSRQMSIAYLLPLVWMTISRVSTLTPAPLPEKERGLLPIPNRGFPRILMFLAVIFLALGVPMAMNWLKFGHPLESGYMFLYEGRTDDVFARDARAHGIFSMHYVPRKLYYTNMGFPAVQPIKRGDDWEWYLAPQLWGTGIWWTTPFLILIFFNIPGILADPRRRMLLIAAGIAYIGLMVYHSTGYKQRGYNRYSLDYVPALFTLAVPAALASPWRKVIAVSLIGWSVFYFAVVRQWPQIRIW